MKMRVIYLCILVTISACQSEQDDPILEPQHFALDEILDFLPFEQFNNHSLAIFRDSLGNEFAFSLDVNEKLSGNFETEIPYTYNQISFRYGLEFDFGILPITVIATMEDLPDRGLTEMIFCRFSSSQSFEKPELEIIPKSNYKNTLFNEEYTWVNETFANVYSNKCIVLNNQENLKILFQPSLGIIGLTDESGRQWIFDRFE